MAQQARSRHITPSCMRSRMAKITDKFNRLTPWPQVPEGNLIAVADAMIEYINGMPHTIFFVLLREISSKKAVIMPIYVVIGEGERLRGWKAAFALIPDDVRKRIKVMVCDGINALKIIAIEEGWILQRCHFHLRARIVHNCSPGRFGKRPELAKNILKLTEIILTNEDEKIISYALANLSIIKQNITARLFRTTLSGFIKHYEDFRAYLRYPEYHIPTTSNSAEYLIGQIRDLQYRARGFSSLKSLSAWIEAYCKFTKTITCNGKIYTPN